MPGGMAIVPQQAQMSPPEALRIGYVVKRYPRYSETFVVNEILAHERAGLELDIFSLRAPNDTHFQDVIARVRAPVTCLSPLSEVLTADSFVADTLKVPSFWEILHRASDVLPGLWSRLETARGEEPGDVYQALLLARETRLRGIRHLHAHFASSATTVARLAAGFACLPYSFTAHAKDIFHESVRPEHLRRKLSDAAAVITVSDYNVQHLRTTFGAAAARVQRIYNGLDLEQFPYESPRERPRRIVAVGRLVEKKGFADLLAACALLARRGEDFHCQVIGTGPLAADLRARIERLGLQRHVELLGPRPQGEVVRCIQGAAVLAVPSVVGTDGNRDGLPNVIVEAMALGTPCVATDVTGIPEVVRDGETGVTVPQRDEAALAKAIERLLADGTLRVQIAARARRLIEREFDIRESAARLRAIFQEASTADAAGLMEMR